MKIFLQIIIFLSSSGVFACSCDVPSITEKYIQSDFVAIVTITKIYHNKKNEQGYRAAIKINKLFKGAKLKSIYVYGRSDDGVRNSCDIFIPENTRLVVYAKKNNNGNFGVGMCSGLLYLTQENTKRQEREFDILKMFKAKNIDYTDKTSYRESGTLHKNLEQFNGIKLNKSYGIFEITFTTDLKIKSVSEISGFGNYIDQKLIEIIRKTEWTSLNNEIKDKVPDDSKLLIGIYYFIKEKGTPSFLSPNYH